MAVKLQPMGAGSARIGVSRQTVRINTITTGGSGGGNYTVYGGDYTVTPSLSQQTLQTSTKLMSQDVTVAAIPVTRTANSTGTTVRIGG